MKITRRAAIAGALLPLAARAQAPEWPSRPVRFIVPYPPGGPTDIMGRIIAQAVQGPLGQPFVVENRAGANGLIGSEQAARAAPDGSTFLVNASAHVIVPHLTPNMPIDVLADFAPVTNIAAVPLWLVVNPALPVRSVADFIAYARANPGRISYASSSSGGATHLAGELFKQLTGTDMVHVPYRGSGDALVDLLSGSVQMMNEIVIYPHVKAGRLNLLAVNNPTRHWDFPDVPTMTEVGFPDSDVPIWFSAWAPTGTSKEIITIFNQKLVELSGAPEMTQRMKEMSFMPAIQTPEEMAVFFNKDWDANALVIREAKITLV